MHSWMFGQVDCQRMLDMDRRVQPVRRNAMAVLAGGLLICAPWLGWWTLAPLVLAVGQAAGEMGGRIRSFHKQIKGRTPDGQPYRALEPVAYAWVHATLAEGIVAAHERFGRPFTEEQREQLWAEWRALGRLLGIRAGDLPADWPRFRDYVDEMVHRELEHTSAVDEVLATLARPAPPALMARLRPAWTVARQPLGHFLGLSTAGLLPPALRRRFGLSWTGANELELRVLGAGLRAATPLMPAALRNTGPAYLRWRHEAIARGDVASRVR